jgi:thiosulfate dehydrogenase [quinone] large subunit
MVSDMSVPARPDVSPGDPLAESRLNRVLIAVFRVVVALLWIQNSSWKTPPDFGHATPPRGLYKFTLDGVEHQVLAPWAWLVKHLILPNFSFFGWMTLIVEASLGAFLLIGLLTRFWALVGIAQTIAITLSVLNTPGEWPWSYFLMLIAHVGLFATAAGRFYGLDGMLREQWLRSDGRLAGLLARLS